MTGMIQIAWLLAMLAVVFGSPIEEVAPPNRALTRLRMPNNDEWYRPEKGYEHTAPGTILKYRPVPKGLSLNNKDAMKISGWQILYRTSDSAGEPDATVVTLLVPKNANKKTLLVYHWFSDASFSECVPSVTMQPGTRADNAYTQIQNIMALIALGQGWYTAVPDDGGPDGVFGSGRRGGHSALDAVRAIKQSGNFTGINPDPMVQSYGYSGGAWGGYWTSALQPSYAPDVKLSGTAIGGLLPNVTQLALNWNLPNRTTYGPPVLIGLAKDYKNMSEWLDTNLIPEKKAEFMKGGEQCFDANWEAFSGKLIGDYFKGGLPSLLGEVPTSVWRETSEMGRAGKPSNPMYVYQTVGDDASPIWITDKLIKTYCDQGGVDITFDRNPRFLGHSGEMIEGLPGAMRWIADRFQGKPAAKGCLNMTVTEESVRSARQGLTFRGIFDIAVGAFGMPIGPSPLTDFLTKFPERIVKLD